MIKNYFTLNKLLNFKTTIYLLFICLAFSQVSNAQCVNPSVGCATTDLSNFGSQSNTNAATIEYDNFVSSWHTTVVRTSDGSFQTWGEKIQNSGATNANVLTPTTINSTNFPALTGTPLKAGLGSTSQNNLQGIVLATDGLYAWSTAGIVLSTSLTTGTVFQKLTIGGNPTGLPTGVTPGDVKMMFVTSKTLVLTTCGGDVWVISQTLNVRGNGTGATSDTTWYRVTTSDTGNPFLTDVVACRGNVDGLMALKSDGSIYVWGTNVLLGNNTAIVANQNRAVKMTLPAGKTPKMIGSTGSAGTRSYYVLATDGNLYSLGNNSSKQLGDWTTTNRLSWVQPRYTSASGPVMNDIKWLSPQEHDATYAAINVITNAKKLYAFGNSNNSLIGRAAGTAAAASLNDPGMPSGVSLSDDILAVETGGHTSMIVKACEAKFGYVGHRTNGSMGNGSAATLEEASYSFATANVQICGAESNPAIQSASTGGGPDSKYCVGDPVLLTPTPAGGTLSVVSGPATLTGNTVNFTAAGTAIIKYTVANACGAPTETSRTFEASLCPIDLEVTKTVDVVNASVGSNSTFTITTKNNGPYKATGVKVNDVLPAGYTFVSATPSTGTWTAPDWTVGSLTSGTSETLSIVATVNASGPYANTATVTGNDPDTNTVNNSATATPLVQTNLSVSKTVSTGTHNVGSDVTFTITASNAGPSSATGVTVSDALPAGYTFVSATPSTGTWLAPSWTIGNLANGGTATLSIVAKVNATGSYANTATISGGQNDPTPGNNSGSATATVNHAPVANDDDLSASPLTEDGANGTVNILSNDTDEDGNPTAPVNGAGQFTVDLDPAVAGIQTTYTDAKGVWTLNTTTGIVTFNPADNYNGTAKITYTLCDTFGLCDNADITFVVTSVNDNPVANNDTKTTNEDTAVTIDVTTNDTDVDGTINKATVDLDPATPGIQNTFTVAGQGTYTVDALGIVTFTPVLNYNGTTTPINYTVNDNDGAVSNIATITVTVTAVNDNPVAVNDVYTVAEDNTVTLNPLALDSDVDGDTLTITSINGTTLTGLAQTITVPNGTVNISATGVITFTPNANFNSATAISFPYVISDGKGGTATANQLITVTSVNDNPVANNDTETTNEDTVVTIDVTANDTDVDGTINKATVDLDPATPGIQTTFTVTGQGTYTVNNLGIVTFTPVLNFNGAATPINYTVNDNDGAVSNIATITVTVTSVNDNPVAVNDVYTVAEDNTVTLNPLALDSDVDGDTLTITSINGTTLTGSAQTIIVPNGTVNISATGVITFTPNANFNSATAISFPYVISDGKGGTATANQLITVTSVNDNPVANNDTETTNEDTIVTIDVTANDTDVDGTINKATVDLDPATPGIQTTFTVTGQGTYTVNNLGIVTFTPVLNFNGVATPINYTVNDNDGAVSNIATITVTVTAVNDNPVAVDDVYTVAEDGSLTLNPLNLDSDVDGDTLTITSINGTTLTGLAQTITVPNGTVNISATGVITFTPDANFNSATAISFPYVISDGKGGTATANQLITVTSVNDNPVANNDTETTNEDTIVTIDVTANDTDVDGTINKATVDLDPATPGIQTTFTVTGQGTYTVNNLGIVTFTPVLNFNGAATPVNYTVNDNDGAVSNIATITVTVTAVNDNPVAVNDVYTVAEDGSLTLNPLALDSDVDGDTLTITSINGTTLTGGVQTITVPNGTVNISATGVITFTPDANFNSATAISFPYVISDGHGGTATANQLITVTSVNDNPVAVDDVYTVAEDGSLTLNPLALDSDVDGDILTITSINGTTLTGLAQVITVPNGTINISATGVITFTPDTNFNSATAISFPYVISDGKGGTATANQLITVTSVNDNPVAVDDVYTVAEDNSVTLNPLALDSDVDGDTLTITSINGTTLTGGVQTITVPNGTVNISATGVITFTPDTNFNSATAISFPYVISDGKGGTATANQLITVTSVNDNPVAVDDVYTVAEDNTVTLNPLALDSDVDGDTLTITSINGTTLTGLAQTITVPNGTVNISATGVITFTPDANFNSATAISFPYVISDGKGGTATANQLITVTSVNDNPVAVDDAYTVAEDGSLTLNPLNLDSDVDGDTLTITSINGTTLTGGVQTITVPNGTVNISATGVITFTPDVNFNSATAISFPYVISDGKGGTATANQLITVTSVNDNPVANNDTETTNEDTVVTIDVTSNDTDVDGTINKATVDLDPATPGIQTTFTVAGQGTYTVNNLGIVTFTPVLNYNGTTTPINYTVNDNDAAVSNIATITVTVTAVNDNPVAVDDAYTVAEDNTVTLNPLALDSDVDGDTLTITSINGTTLTGLAQTITVPNGTVNISATGVITFTPDANFNSATAISFPYVISDGKGGTATANQLITVTSVNDNPVAVDDTYTVAEDGSLTLNPLNLDSDVDGDTLTITSINGVTLTGLAQTITTPNGTVNISATGVITFTPDANFNSATAISFPYVISDGKGGTATANQLITVTSVNDNPVAVDDVYTVAEDGSLTLNPLALDSDVDGDTLTITSINGTTLTGSAQTITVPNGTVNISATGVITFTPDANFNSATAISFPYVISDGKGGTATANQLITVTAVNDNPVAVDDVYTVAEDNTVTLNPLALDSDVDGDSLTITSINGTTLTGLAQVITVPNGTVNISATGVITFTPDANFNSATAISFPYVISDGKGGTATANQLITVTSVNDNPVAVDDVYTVAEDGSLTLNPLALDSDVDGDTLTITSINGTTLTGSAQTITVPNGTVNISATGVITFTPDANFNSATAISFPYVISDGKGGTATANQLITVTAVNDNPVAVDDVYTVAEDNTVTLNPLALDSDVDGDSLTITSINGTTLTGLAQVITVPNGTVNISATGVITFTPDANFNSATAISFPYVISDGKGGTATANQLITVTSVNDNPVAVDDVYTVAEDNSVTLNPLALDSDVDGDTLTITSINATTLTGLAQVITVPNGTVNISATGVITFTPDANFNSATAISFPYVISDGKGGTATANQLITVTSVNDNPVAVDDTYTVAEDTTVTLNPLNLDSDIDGDTLTITSINGTTLTGLAQVITVPNGTVNIPAAGVITFTPDANFNSATAISFPYVISDGKGGTATANQLITVTSVNDNPVAVDDTYTVAEDGSLTLNPLNLDSDIDGDTLTITSINGTTLTGSTQTITVPNGTINISATGVITFTPDANFNSATAISFPYVISDGKGGTATANQLITVTSVNDNPVAVDDAYTVAEDGSLTLNPLNLDSDVDGDTLTITSINGTTLTGLAQVITVPNGTVNISAAGVITFTPDANFNSATAISFPYVISDGKGGTATANQLITVTSVNDNPVAVDDVYTVAEDNTVTLNPLALDSDVDGDTLTITSINGTTLTGLAQTITVPNGTVNISATGVITFTPDANFNSATAISFPYVISDGKGGTATANQLITVTSVNDNPVAVDDVYTVAEDGSLTLNPLALDSDVDGDTLKITSINGTTLTGLAQVITVPNGTVNISATGVITFTPDANFNSATAISFPYVISDEDGGTATANQLITVTSVNDAPIANNDTNPIISSTAGATTINALTATDIDGTIASYTVLSLPTNGVLALAGVPVTVNQILTPAEAASLTYAPSGTFTGNDTFTFTATDDLGAVALPSATITIPVGNNAPVAQDDTNASIPSRAGATPINALKATDTDGTVVNYTILSLPAHGVLALSGTAVLVNQVLTPLEVSMLTYDPSGAFSGNDTFTFTATDNDGAIDASPAVITIVVDKTVLVAVSDPINSVVGINKTVTVTNIFNNDTLNNSPLNPLDVDLHIPSPDPTGILTLKPDGTVELAPNAPAGNYTLTYEICEKANPSNCSPATVTVKVVSPTMTVTANSYCSNNTPYVSYTVTADNFTPTDLLTINWLDSANNIVATQSNMALSGSVLWPGATVDANNNPTDWPGWVLVNGQWTQGNDGFELTRPAVTMQFTLNPTQSVVVNYPSAITGCNAMPTFGIQAGNDDDVTLADGLNGSLEVINVLANDKLNSVPVKPSDVILKGVNLPTGITINADGTLDVAPGTKGGNYTLTYQICEVANSSNCSTATVKIFVEVPAIAIVKTVVLNDTNGNGYAEAGETLTYNFTITNKGNTDLENILVSDPLPGIVMSGGPINLGVGQSDNSSITGNYTLTQSDVNSGSISNQATASGITKSGIIVIDKSDSSDIDGEKPTVITLSGCVIKIFNAVSSNGDDKNERFYVQGLECYPDNTVQIYNRWGVLVFERDHYNNNDIAFRGISEGRVTIKDSDGLPEGTYYYIIKYKDMQSNPHQEAGYLYLTK